MSESYEVELNNTSWTDISQGNTVGFISNIGKARVALLQADSQPDDSVTDGHPLESIDDINFSLIQDERIWGKSIQAKETVIVTPGI